MGPRGAGSGRVGPSRAEWGRVGPVRAGGEGLGMHWDSIIYSKTKKDRPSGAAWGPFGPSGAE